MPKKKILVLVANYPTSSSVSLMYVHVRNKYYLQQGMDVTVLNFKTDENYEIDGIKVISLKSYENSSERYDTLILHAVNLRNHYRFLRQYEKRFAHLVFFFHGHEVVKLNEAYPKPYDFLQQKSWLKWCVQGLYDQLKLSIWHRCFPKIANKSDFIFVSQSFYVEAQRYLRLTDADFAGHVHIINNSVGKMFEERSYAYSGKKEFDFITIRSNIDESTYCVDLLCQTAERNPQFTFLLIGQGKFFQHYQKPDNLIWVNKVLDHESLLECIDKSRCALMLTRRDTQGVMSCELATYGIRLITSDLEITREIFAQIPWVTIIKHELPDTVELEEQLKAAEVQAMIQKCDKYNYKNTVEKEVEVLLQQRTAESE